ncbi:MAG: peptidylprolyl isomerase [Oceanococcus sp.]
MNKIGLVFFSAVLSVSWTTAALADSRTATNSPTEQLSVDEINLALSSFSKDDIKFLAGSDTTTLLKFALQLHSNNGLLREAEELGLNEDPVLLARIETSRQQILTGELLSRTVKNLKKPALEEIAQERYLASKEDFRVSEKRQVSHIMRTDLSMCPCPFRPAEQAIFEIYDRLNQGQLFSELAKAESHDVGSRHTGGVLPNWIERKQKTEQSLFDKAVFELEKVGDVSEPFRTQKGWHIVKLDQLAPSHIPSFDSIKEDLKQQMWTNLQLTALERQRSKHYPDPSTIDIDALKRAIENAAN